MSALVRGEVGLGTMKVPQSKFSELPTLTLAGQWSPCSWRVERAETRKRNYVSGQKRGGTLRGPIWGEGKF